MAQSKEVSNSFIEEFAPLYFNPDDNNPDVLTKAEYDRRRIDLGLSSLNSVDIEAENVVMKFLQSGDYGVKPLAWKAGKVFWNKAKQELDYSRGFEKDDGYSIGQRGIKVTSKDFEYYCSVLYKNKDDLNQLALEKNYLQAYKKALFITEENEKLSQTSSPYGFGPVNIINALFFVTKGRIPIYDAFAHMAVRALAFDFSPNQVYLGANPDKKDVKGVTKMLEEYILLLDKVFPYHVNTDGEKPYIERDLDRALWVYGHSCNKYPITDDLK